MITHMNRTAQSQCHLTLLSAFNCGPEPICEETARRHGLAEALSYCPDDLHIIVALGNALEDHVSDAGPLEYTGLDLINLKSFVSYRIGTLAANLAGFFCGPNGWSNGPIYWRGDLNHASLSGLTFDGFELVPDA